MISTPARIKIELFDYQPFEISQNVTNGSLQISLSDHTVITLSGVTNAQRSTLTARVISLPATWQIFSTDPSADRSPVSG
ncbi:Adhesin family protein [Granulibacter bethesdensis]|uniref:Adhesin family protein n=1 Tax=Granulibacter bethesdensis TaxID=364410 RepID=A0AAC9KEF4_9PROT|nr:hypothetical protein [Granulibacter bethesdensis]APH54713.1 Adhesin family protein [Granulibacter bethesdensis]APH62300.1 Adhesin family protein [Granulibacter bethesdensis]